MTLPQVVTSNYSDSKYEKSPLSENDIADTFNRIKALMSEKHYYKQRNLKLIHIAKELGIPAYQISQVINQTTGESFADFINGFRVEEAKTILLKSYSKYTIEGIGQEAGFKSRASFYAAFKKHTNLTPSQFLKK
jgi:YesN/AraC family two-component response regulator